MRRGGLRRLLAGIAVVVLLAMGWISTAFAQNAGTTIRVLRSQWTEADERGFSEFIQGLGDADCNTVDRCLKSAANPFARTDPAGVRFSADCADLPYFLRAYYAWKRGLPFSYIAAVSPLGSTSDIRYTARGNEIAERRNVLTGSNNGPQLLVDLRNTISSAMFRLHPDMEQTDLYPVRIDRKAIRPGTVLYDPNGHLAIVYRIEEDGRILYMDAHPDNSLTRGTYGRKFVRSSPGMGAGFKNWRPLRVLDAAQLPDGSLAGGRIKFARNAELPDFSVEQFFGNGSRPADREWASGTFALEGQVVDYYDFVRARLGGGSLSFDPLREVQNMVRATCEDIRYRAEAVELAVRAGVNRKAQPPRLPLNIYGTEGEWEEFSTPSRDARLKTSFLELRSQVQRFAEWHAAGDKRIHYKGNDIAAGMLAAYEREAAACTVTYSRSNGAPFTLSYEEVGRRMFLLSFDPYHCVERRWGASQPGELATCSDDRLKQDWYAAEQSLRNQIDRTYEARMDFSLEDLRAGPGPGRGVAAPPDIDVRRYLQGVSGMKAAISAPSTGGRPGAAPSTGRTSPASTVKPVSAGR